MMKGKLIILFLISLSILACKNKSESRNVELSVKTENKTSSEQQIMYSEEETVVVSELSCNCFNGIGSTENDKPIFISTFSNGTSVSLCGFFDKEMQDEGIIMSEFNIFNCETGDALVEYGAMQICRIEEKKDTLTIYELKYLPIGTNWNWELIQVAKQEILVTERNLIVNPQIPELEKFSIEETEQTEFLNSLKKGSGFSAEWESDLGKLEVLSLLGSEKAWKILKNYEEFTGDKTDGALAEQWKSALATVEWIK